MQDVDVLQIQFEQFLEGVAVHLQLPVAAEPTDIADGRRVGESGPPQFVGGERTADFRPLVAMRAGDASGRAGMAAIPRVSAFPAAVHPQHPLPLLQFHDIVIRQPAGGRLGECRADGWPPEEPVRRRGVFDRFVLPGDRRGLRPDPLVDIARIRPVQAHRAVRALAHRRVMARRRRGEREVGALALRRPSAGRTLRPRARPRGRRQGENPAGDFADVGQDQAVHAVHLLDLLSHLRLPVVEQGQIVQDRLIGAVRPAHGYHDLPSTSRSGSPYLAGATVW